MPTFKDLQQKREEQMINDFCVMFERAHRENSVVESGDFWTEKMALFHSDSMKSVLDWMTDMVNEMDETMKNPEDFYIDFLKRVKLTAKGHEKVGARNIITSLNTRLSKARNEME